MHKETWWVLYGVLLWAIVVMLFLNQGHAAGTNPAGMTGLERDQIFAGPQAVIPKVEFDCYERGQTPTNTTGIS